MSSILKFAGKLSFDAGIISTRAWVYNPFPYLTKSEVLKVFARKKPAIYIDLDIDSFVFIVQEEIEEEEEEEVSSFPFHLTHISEWNDTSISCVKSAKAHWENLVLNSILLQEYLDSHQDKVVYERTGCFCDKCNSAAAISAARKTYKKTGACSEPGCSETFFWGGQHHCATCSTTYCDEHAPMRWCTCTSGHEFELRMCDGCVSSVKMYSTRLEERALIEHAKGTLEKVHERAVKLTKMNRSSQEMAQGGETMRKEATELKVQEHRFYAWTSVLTGNFVPLFHYAKASVVAIMEEHKIAIGILTTAGFIILHIIRDKKNSE